MGIVAIKISVEIPEMVAARQWDGYFAELIFDDDFKELNPLGKEPEIIKFTHNFGDDKWRLLTQEGNKVVNVGDWLVKDNKGNYEVIPRKNFIEVVRDGLEINLKKGKK